MRIGIVCPYSFDVPGGVQYHIRDLAEALIALGHEVSVLAPAEDERELPPYAVSAGRAVAVKYNGSVARLTFGPISAARVRRWLARGQFDVLHVHEPVTPSLSMMATLAARGPVVATFHTAMTRSRTMAAGASLLQLVLEKITARIAVSALARKVQVEHLGGGAVEIPNGVAVSAFAGVPPLDGWPGDGGTVGFLGRFNEPRKGFDVLVRAFAQIAPDRPGLRLLLAGPGELSEVDMPEIVRERLTYLGKVSDEDRARMLRSLDVYVAPNIGGESFGMILTEAMAAGATILASDIDAFRRVLDDGRGGEVFPVGDADALAAQLAALLDDPGRRAELSAGASRAVSAYDWPVVAKRIVEVYATAISATTGVVVGDDPELDARLAGLP
ncbi:glycosyltransferase family 4 protein [Longispora albida]|uniref:glycosyltransferase family 4 protein n=1 Tax=Longispora albida TaxID=203523 RepID=UPI00035CAF5C|nr:glycosyltransferase family 4 protein [Longispora albida]